MGQSPFSDFHRAVFIRRSLLFAFHHIGEVLDNDDRCFLVVVAEGVVDEDFGNLFRIEALAPAEDGGPFQVVYISNDGTVGAGGFLIFSHTLSVSAGP